VNNYLNGMIILSKWKKLWKD